VAVYYDFEHGVDYILPLVELIAVACLDFAAVTLNVLRVCETFACGGSFAGTPAVFLHDRLLKSGELADILPQDDDLLA
jgi:hypothetical protein